MIYKSIYSSPLGYLEICADGEDALTRVYFTSSPSKEYTPNAVTETAAVELEEYFAGKRRHFDVPLSPDGSAFEKAVWEACREIAYGTHCTAKELALKIGDDKAVRKVTAAIEKNPIAVIIPDHRVKGKSNFLSGFGAAAAFKEALLGAEINYLKKQ